MHSKEFKDECFVYITLPGETKGVTAGRFVMSKNKIGNSVGQLVYGKSYLARPDALEIDPVELRLGEKIYATARLQGIFGSLRDAGPDYWGRLVIERHSGKSGLTEIDYLLESPDDRAGALGFGLNQSPPSPMKKFNKTIELERLQQIAENLVQERFDLQEPPHDQVQIKELLLVQTSMGGARPKVVVEDGAGLWIAKFGRSEDRWNNPKVEHAMLELARSCGITAAKSRIEKIGGKDVLLVKRFDREKVSGGYTRARMISALTLLQADESAQKRDRWSYVLMAEELRRVSANPRDDAAELFRRMCFNALISNTDDHPRNHAMIAPEKNWKLSPAYDLTPSPSTSQQRDLALTCGDMGRLASSSNLMSQRSRFLLSENQAETIIVGMSKQIKEGWYKSLRAQGVSDKDSAYLKTAFAYEGFDQ